MPPIKRYRKYSRWTDEEKLRYFEARRLFSGDWARISAFVETRTANQVRAFWRRCIANGVERPAAAPEKEEEEPVAAPAKPPEAVQVAAEPQNVPKDAPQGFPEGLPELPFLLWFVNKHGQFPDYSYSL